MLKCAAMISSFLNRPRAFDEIIQMHVPELVDLVAAVARADEAHLGDQDLRIEERRVVIEARG